MILLHRVQQGLLLDQSSPQKTLSSREEDEVSTTSEEGDIQDDEDTTLIQTYAIQNRMDQT